MDVNVIHINRICYDLHVEFINLFSYILNANKTVSTSASLSLHCLQTFLLSRKLSSVRDPHKPNKVQIVELALIGQSGQVYAKQFGPHFIHVR